jgi:hypothetical protein
MFAELGLEHFVEKTKIVDALFSHCVSPRDVGPFLKTAKRIYTRKLDPENNPAYLATMAAASMNVDLVENDIEKGLIQLLETQLPCDEGRECIPIMCAGEEHWGACKVGDRCIRVEYDDEDPKPKAPEPDSAPIPPLKEL